ncbi:hypothetical protein D9758_016343 [Tetrapyrgos nigripes]|uniref:FAD/NAD(P)-binding domain-containing protein n=1 Tax=Tetrapyrgos nigripes TaxID=182062 RepID=A0A8H5FCE1_9AGAR|nr:hypothetical protein D9758_016343 [Tetrapyrgos nigripes]
MRLNILLSSLLPVFVRAAVQDPVCVVGAGPTGLAAAHALEAKNYSVVIFDKELEVGGKCQAYYDGVDGSLWHPMGALVVSNASYTETVPIIKDAGVPFLPGLSVTTGWDYPPLSPGDSVVNVTRMPTPTLDQIALILLEVPRYTALRDAIVKRTGVMRYTNGVPNDLTIPMGQWLSKNGFEGLPIIVNASLQLIGYGDLEHTPALYALKYLSADLLAWYTNLGTVNFVGEFHPIPSDRFINETGFECADYHAVFLHYASSIHGQIHTNTAVTKIDRSGPSPVLTHVSLGSTQPQTQVQNCSHLVLAFPPILEALQSTGSSSGATVDWNTTGIDMDLSPSETSVFSRVGLTAYFSGAVGMPQVPPQVAFAQLPTADVGQPVLMTKMHQGSGVVGTYSWGPWTPTGRGNLSVEEARNILLQTYSRVDFSPASADSEMDSENTSGAIPITDQDVREFRKWDYFPRFQSEDLANGIYDKYNALQGQQKTYWASGLNGFEMVEYAIQAGKEIVETFF